MLRRGVLAAVALAAAVGLAPPAPAAAEPQRYLDRVFAEVSTTLDIPYGAAPDEDGIRQELNLDLYQPVGDTETRRPVIILAHGGSFYEGSKAAMAGQARAFAQRGFVAMSIEYRMDEGAGPVRFPPNTAALTRIFAAKTDMQAAVRWARANAWAYRLDPGKVSVGGYSAGAVTALLTATTPDVPGASGTPGISSAVCTAVSQAGAGSTLFVDGGDAGAIFFHGDRDTTVPYSEAVATYQAMAAAGLTAQLVTFPGVAHGLSSNAALIEQRSAEWLVDTMVERPTSCAGPVDPTNGAFVQALFADFLSRPPSADELTRETDWLDSGGSRSVLLDRTTTSVEWVQGIVRGFYLDTLGREPDPTGLGYWVGQIRVGRRTVAQVAAELYAAPEYLARVGGTTEAWIASLYDAVLERPAGDEDVAFWVDQVQRSGRTKVAVQIYGSVESRRTRVTALYDVLLGRAPDAAGLAFWVERVATTGDLALARDLAASPEYRSRAALRFP